MKHFRRSLFLVGALALSLTWGTSVYSQAWPSKPIKLVVTFAPGGGADFVGRAIGGKLTESLGQPVVVDNRAGGGGLIGNEIVAKATPDGNTLLLGAAGPLTVAPHLYNKIGYNTLKDLVPVALIAATPFVLVVHPSVPANNLKELTALAKRDPGKLTFGSSGSGGAPHLAGELYRAMASVNLVHAPYKGLAPAINDLLGGHIQVLFADTGLVLQHIKSGKLKALAFTGRQRSVLLPDVPTMIEGGLRDYEAGSWYGILAPASTSVSIINRINNDVHAALAQADVQKQLVAQGMETVNMSPEQFNAILREDYEKWGKLIKESNIKLE